MRPSHKQRNNKALILLRNKENEVTPNGISRLNLESHIYYYTSSSDWRRV